MVLLSDSEKMLQRIVNDFDWVKVESTVNVGKNMVMMFEGAKDLTS